MTKHPKLPGRPKASKFAAIKWPKMPRMGKDRGAMFRTERRDQARPAATSKDEPTDAERRAMFAAIATRGGRRSGPRTSKSPRAPRRRR